MRRDLRGWNYMSVEMLGRTVQGITAIKYSETTEKTNFYGRGEKPIGRGRGKYTATASLTLYSYEVEAIVAALPQGSKLTDVAPFDVTVVFRETADSPLTKDILCYAEFTGNMREIKAGDGSIEVQLDLIISEIKFNA